MENGRRNESGRKIRRISEKRRRVAKERG